MSKLEETRMRSSGARASSLVNAARKAFCVPRGEGGSFGRSSKEEVWIDPLSVVSTGHCGQYVATVSSKERKEKRKQKEKKKQKKSGNL